MSVDDDEFNKSDSNKYEKTRSINSTNSQPNQINEHDLSIQSEESSHIYPNKLRNGTNRTSNLSKTLTRNSKYSSTISTNDDTLNNLTKFDISSNTTHSQLSSSSDTKSNETTKSELIKRILDSIKPTTFNFKSSSDSTINTSLSSIDKTRIPCQSINISNKIYIHFKDKNELGMKPHIDDLLEYTKKGSCHRIEISFDNNILNQQLSYKQKQSILRLILHRQQMYDRYFSQSN